MKLQNNWQYKRLEELEKDKWPDPGFRSRVITRVHELRRTPLNEFTIGDVRLMISQNQSLDYMVPKALEMLEVNLLAEGDFYEGDLAKSVLNIPLDFWDLNQAYRNKLDALIANSIPEN